MQDFINLINTYADYITLIILTSFLIAILFFIIVIIKLNKTKKRYEALLRGMNTKNLEDIILNNAEQIRYLEQFIKITNEQIEEIESNLGNCLKNISLERYNAFQGIGGEQSFSLALLDDNGTGIVITSIHTRDDARTYAKWIRKGFSQYQLSEEEKNVINKALNEKSTRRKN